MFKSLKISVLVVCLALLGLAALPAYPRTETASVTLNPVEVENTRQLLGENPTGPRPDPSQDASRQDGAEGDAVGGTMTLSIPKLGLEDIPVPTADSQIALDREGIIRFGETGTPWEEGSNTFIVGHALGFLWTRTPYVFYKLEDLKPGDEIIVRDQADEEYVFEVYDRVTVKPEDFWVTYPVPNKTTISLQTCTPIPTFENRLVVRGELIS